MDLAIYKKLEREYDKKRLKAQEESNSRKIELCEKIKELNEAVEELNKTAIVNAKSVFCMAKDERQWHMANLQEKMSQLQERVYNVLETNRLSKRLFRTKIRM